MKLGKSVPQQLMNPAQVEKLEPEPEPNIWSWNFSQAETEQKNVLRTQGRTQAEHPVPPKKSAEDPSLPDLRSFTELTTCTEPWDKLSRSN